MNFICGFFVFSEQLVQFFSIYAKLPYKIISRSIYYVSKYLMRTLQCCKRQSTYRDNEITFGALCRLLLFRLVPALFALFTRERSQRVRDNGGCAGARAAAPCRADATTRVNYCYCANRTLYATDVPLQMPR